MSPQSRNRVVVYRNETFPLGGTFSGTTRGYRYFCKTCGEVFAGMELAERGEYTILCFPCEKHGTQYQTGGSLLKPLMWWDAWSGPDLAKAWGKFSPEFRRHELLARANQILGVIENG